MLSVLAFIANTLNSIMKSTICFFPYLNVLILYLESAALLLSLNAVLISLTKLSQSQMLFFSSTWLIFFYAQIFDMPFLSWASTAVILSSIAITLLLLRNNQISLHQPSNFIWSPLNHPRSRTILFSITTYAILLYTASIDAINISSDNTSSVVLFLSEAYSLVILNNPNIS